MRLEKRVRVSPRFEYQSQVKIKKTNKADALIESELADFALLLALCVKNGLSVERSFTWISQRMSGDLSTRLKEIVRRVDLGESFIDALTEVASESKNSSLSEFASKLSLSISRGTPISEALIAQAGTINHQLAQKELQKANSNETKMLLPMVFLILPTSVLMASFPSLSNLGLGI
jgi:tight adherence protein C